jgi:hypothetical protein
VGDFPLSIEGGIRGFGGNSDVPATLRDLRFGSSFEMFFFDIFFELLAEIPLGSCKDCVASVLSGIGRTEGDVADLGDGEKDPADGEEVADGTFNGGIEGEDATCTVGLDTAGVIEDALDCENEDCCCFIEGGGGGGCRGGGRLRVTVVEEEVGKVVDVESLTWFLGR